MKKDYYIIIDTETTIDDLVADFGAVVVDKKGRIVDSVGYLILGIYNNREKHPLFYNYDDDGIWSKRMLDTKYHNYNEMLNNGTRTLAPVSSVNTWLKNVKERYNPTLTAYNINFDKGKCRNTGINLNIFKRSFCLWWASAEKWAHTKAYREFIINGYHWNTVTKKGNMCYQTKAETMCKFVLNCRDMPDEPHLSLEDARDYELPILIALLKNTPKARFMKPKPHSWRDYQVREWFKPS